MSKEIVLAQAEGVAKIDARIQALVQELEYEIRQLEEKKRVLLQAYGITSSAPRRRGRPPGSTNAAALDSASEKAIKTTGKRKKFSEETKRILSEKRRAYWAARRAAEGKAGKK